MKKNLIALPVIFACHLVFSQDTAINRKVVFRAQVTSMNRYYDEAFLHTVTDSGVFLARVPVALNKTTLAGYQATWHPYGSIDRISIKRKGSAGRGALIGAVSGVVAGGLIGLALYRRPEPTPPGVFELFPPDFMDFGPGGNAVLGATGGLLVGVVTGAIIGSLAKKTFIIKGKKEKFMEMRSRLTNRLCRNPYHVSQF